MLTKSELERYDRQIQLPQVGIEGQKKIKQARILIAGAGGLGSPSALYLSAAGVGTIGIVDHDVVELSNLNRQILHWDADLGKAKPISAAEKLQKLNRGITVTAIEETITETSVSRILTDFDMVIDAMDNLASRYILNKAALEKNIPLFHGAVYGLEGRAMTVIPGETACLRCVYRGAVPEKRFPVFGTTPAVIGCIQATEAIKYIVGAGELLKNRLLIYDGLSMSFSELEIKRDPHCEHCGDKRRV
jgi:molybdopterin-synthase adenylyltransferase